MTMTGFGAQARNWRAALSIFGKVSATASEHSFDRQTYGIGTGAPWRELSRPFDQLGESSG
jgi:hypothetical protein